MGNSVKALAALVFVVFMFALGPVESVQGQTQPQEFVISFELLNSPDSQKGYDFNLTIPKELYDYYAAQSHLMYSVQDFAQFVTPTALKPVADNLWQIYNNTEDFTNGVLMLVHQLRYQATFPEKFPVETLVAGQGDCDLFCFIAASILKAGGVDSVLIYYKQQEHMEVGVALGALPTEARTQVYSVDYRGVPYYVAECTGEQWRIGWRVGECPDEYQNISSQIIPLNVNMEPHAIGQVFATYQPLGSTNITLRSSSSLVLETLQVTLNGQIIPQMPNENVTLQANIRGSGWTTIGNATTDEDGNFSFTWTPPYTGSILFQANWTGNRHYDGAASSQINIYVVTLYIIPIITAAATAIALTAYLVFLLRKKKPQPPPPQENTPAPVPSAT
jgi:hypothetical protein